MGSEHCSIDIVFNLGWLVCKPKQVGHPNCRGDSKATSRLHILARETLGLALYAPNALGGT